MLTVAYPPRNSKLIHHSSEETTESILKTLFTLASRVEGGLVFAKSEDWSPLVEIAPRHEYVLAIFSWSWLHASASPDIRPGLRDRIDHTIAALAASYKGTDAITLLQFLDKTLGRLDDEVRGSHLCTACLLTYQPGFRSSFLRTQYGWPE